MQSSQIPDKSQRIFAQNAGGAYVRAIPQTTADTAAASYDIGFPPQTFTNESAGGSPPDGRDFNGIFRNLSAWSRWQQAGGPVKYDATFQANIGGYPAGAIVQSASTIGLEWCSTSENNLTNPDTGGAGWIPILGRRATTAEIQAGTEDLKAISPKGLKDAGVVALTSSNLNENLGSRVYSDGFKECWGFVTISAGGTVVVTLPVAHTTWFNVNLGAFIRNTSDAQDNTGLIAKTGVVSFTLKNNENIALRVDWSTRGV